MRNLVLAGFMGTGKSTVGRLIAERLNVPFLDTDLEIERIAGRTVAEVFTRSGEAAFRRLEAEVCLRAAAGQNQIISTGGGALLNPQIYAALAATGVMVRLSCDLDEIIRRVGLDGSRPLFAGDPERLAQLLTSRAGIYERLPHHVDTTGCTPAEVAERVIELWKQHAN